MSTSAHHVVIAFDYSDTASAALQRGLTLAAREPHHVLHFVVVLDPARGVAAMPPEGKVDYAYAERVQADLTERLRGAFQRLALDTEVHFFVHARIGKPADEILQLAIELGADLIVMGSHGRTGLARVVLGSVAERVVREASCPVLVERAKAYPSVPLAQVTEAPATPRTWVTPRRYSYRQTLMTRPPDWPLN